jgi:hypothetical protein
MCAQNAEVSLVANALYEIRLLLAPYLGSENDGPMDVRVAAHIAYALHNEAAAVASGEGFDFAAAIRKVEAIDSILSGSEGTRLARSWDAEPTLSPNTATGQ